MKKIITTLILCSVLTISFACSCRHTPFGVKLIIDSNLFFKGKIIEKANVSIDKEGNDKAFFEKRGVGLFKYKIEVSDYIKGKRGKTIYIYSTMSSAACGADYTVDSEMYIFSYKNAGRNYTSSCSGNFSAEYGNQEPNNTIISDYKKSIKSQKWKNAEGIIDAEGEISKGLPNGIWKFYHADGTLSGIGKYKKGLKKGKWKFYHQDGLLASTGKLKKGKRKGKWKNYLDKKTTLELVAQRGDEESTPKNVLNFITIYKKGEIVDTKYLIKR